MSSDGYIDQNNLERKKFGTEQLLKTLLSIADKPMTEQGDIIKKIINDWMTNTEQRDDISMIGIKI